MARVWSYRDPASGKHYEVRSAGSSLRLYTNGAFHSQFSPKHLFTGAVWDLLSIPALLSPQRKRSRILMLGVGGGTAIHQLNRLLDPAQIVGIERDPVHIKVAKTYFGLTAANIELVQADAFAWMKQSRRKFDVIVDDLFVDAPGDPVRPFKINQSWLNKLQSRLTTQGVLIQNHLSTKSAKLAAKTANGFSTALLFSTPQYENAVLALYQEPVDVNPALAGMKRSIEQIDKRALGKLKYRVKPV